MLLQSPNRATVLISNANISPPQLNHVSNNEAIEAKNTTFASIIQRQQQQITNTNRSISSGIFFNLKFNKTQKHISKSLILKITN